MVRIFPPQEFCGLCHPDGNACLHCLVKVYRFYRISLRSALALQPDLRWPDLMFAFSTTKIDSQLLRDASCTAPMLFPAAPPVKTMRARSEHEDWIVYLIAGIVVSISDYNLTLHVCRPVRTIPSEGLSLRGSQCLCEAAG
jgi:hypothetical protein